MQPWRAAFLLFSLLGLLSCGESAKECEDRFTADSLEYAACHFVEHLQDVEAMYPEDANARAQELLYRQDVWIGQTSYEASFTSSGTCSYATIRGKFKSDYSTTGETYHVGDARFKELSILGQSEATTCNKTPVPHAEISVLLTDGRSFTLRTLVQVGGAWRLVCLLTPL